MRFLTFMLLSLLCFSNSYAAKTLVDIRGTVSSGSGSTFIEDIGGKGYYFGTESSVAAKILPVCGDSDDCELTCEVDLNSNIISVSKVRKIDLDSEPSNVVLKEAMLWASPVHGRTTVQSIDITNTYERVIQGERFLNFEYVVSVKDNDDNSLSSHPMVTVQLVKRGKKWYFYR